VTVRGRLRRLCCVLQKEKLASFRNPPAAERQLQRVVHLDEAHDPRTESLVSAFPGAGHAAEYRRILAASEH